MLQLNDTDKNLEWNLNGTSIIIPVEDGDSTVTESEKIVSPENENQSTPDENLEHSLVNGLDKNIFEPYSTKTDLLLIQDTDLKLFACSPDLKNQLGYSLSFLNQDRSEILWENPGPKNIPKDWAHESAILEVKDILIFDEKANEKINLCGVESESKLLPSKVKQDLPREEEIVEHEKNETNFQLIINYVPESCGVSSRGETGNCEIAGSNIKNTEEKNIFKETNDYDVRISLNNVINFEEEVNEKTSKISEFKQKNILSEKSLPLKNKTKMKKTIICFKGQRSLLENELLEHKQVREKCSFGSKVEKQRQSFQQLNCCKNDLNKIIKRKTQKCENVTSSSPVLTNTNGQPVEPEKESAKVDLLGFDITKFKNIHDLVEGLRQYRLISVPVWQMLNTGLKEMKVDILKEMITKRNEAEDGNYSPQLKAFALVVYFKQPAAFNFLAKVCNSGWPSLNVIKEWKLQLNSHQRPNFVGLSKRTENGVS